MTRKRLFAALLVAATILTGCRHAPSLPATAREAFDTAPDGSEVQMEGRLIKEGPNHERLYLVTAPISRATFRNWGATPGRMDGQDVNRQLRAGDRFPLSGPAADLTNNSLLWVCGVIKEVHTSGSDSAFANWPWPIPENVARYIQVWEREERPTK